MGAFLSYSMLSGLLMLAMYLAYRLFLAGDNQHGFNRGVVLMIYVISFAAVPLIGLLDRPESPVPLQAAVFENIDVAGVRTSAAPLWGTVLIWIFICGMAVVAVKTIVTWVRLMNVIRTGEKVEKAGYTLVVTDNERLAPFSWVRYVVISRKDYEDNSSAITAHELKHVMAHHWIDLLIAQIVCIINWFNPAAWLMRDELMLVHEYQADKAVIECGHDTQAYQMLLIKKAVGSRFPSLANSLNHSKLKKRITMMYKEKSGAGRRLKAFALVPMLALALGVASVPAVRAAVSTIRSSEVSVGKDSEKTIKYEATPDKTPGTRYRVTNINIDGDETTISIEGDSLGNSLSVSGLTFTNGGKTYKDKAVSCSLTDGKATIIATFPFAEKLQEPSMILSANGEEVMFDLDDFSNQPRVVVVRKAENTKADAEVIKINGKEVSSDDMEFYLDGKKISRDDLKNVSTSKIASISVDKQSGALMITTK